MQTYYVVLWAVCIFNLLRFLVILSTDTSHPSLWNVLNLMNHFGGCRQWQWQVQPRFSCLDKECAACTP